MGVELGFDRLLSEHAGNWFEERVGGFIAWSQSRKLLVRSLLKTVWLIGIKHEPCEVHVYSVLICHMV